MAWITVRKDALKNRTRWYEQQLCQRVAALVPTTCQVLLLADRGFATVEFFRFLDALGWQWIIRSKGSITIQYLGAWVLMALLGKERPAHGDYREILYGKRAAGGSYRGRLVVYADLVHTDPWFLMVSAGLADWSWGMVVAGYAKRFTCEESYRDSKNPFYEGFQLNGVKLGTPERWDRLFLAFAWAYYWLNVGGWDVEARGDARHWKANTDPQRTHALWRLGEWGLKQGSVVWRTLQRSMDRFRDSIPALQEVPIPT